VVRGKISSLASPDAHQGVSHERNNFGPGFIVILTSYNSLKAGIRRAESIRARSMGLYFDGHLILATLGI